MKNLSPKEAIALLRNLENSLDSYCELNEEGKTAFRMAIEALSCSEFPNNSDTISRQAAIDALHAHLMYRMGTESNKKRLDEWINSLPSVQPERKTGRWEPFDVPWYRCSECGAVRENITFMVNFCPNCGADMRGDKHETD